MKNIDKMKGLEPEKKLFSVQYKMGGQDVDDYVEAKDLSEANVIFYNSIDDNDDVWDVVIKETVDDGQEY